MNICTRCKKPRIQVKSYEEQVGNSTVTYAIYECSDPECQKVVNKELASDEKRRAEVKNDQLKRELQRKEAMVRKKE